MPKSKITKTLTESAQPEANDYDIRDTVTPGFLLKVTPSGRKMFMLAYIGGETHRADFDRSARSTTAARSLRFSANAMVTAKCEAIAIDTRRLKGSLSTRKPANADHYSN